MKRKLLVLIFVVITCILCAFGIAACKEDKPDNSGGGQGTVQTPPEEKPNDTEKPSEGNKPSDTEKPSVVEVTSVTLNKTTLALEVDGTETLTASITPNNATNKTVTWKSSDSLVAKVENGKITALKAGTATIAATAGSKSATCKVTVTEKVIAVTSVTLNKTTLALEVDDVETLTATVLPNNATDKTVTWSISDSSVVKVENGKVTALKTGTATITATAGSKSATCKVTVTEKVIAVTSVTLNKTTLVLEIDDVETLTATVLPNNATDKTVTWKSSDSAVAKVENGKVTALKAGTATITAIAGGKIVTCNVTVNNKTFKNLVFESKTFTYDGTAKSLAVSNLPQGATVVYQGNEKVEAGSYNVSAAISMQDYQSVTLDATLIIEKRELNIMFNGEINLKYNGTEQKTISAVATNLIGEDEIKISIIYNGEMIEAGQYTATATIAENNNYKLTGNNTIEIVIARAEHSIIFRQQGFKDKVFKVLDLNSFTDVPPTEDVDGYDVVWEEADLSGITCDIIVNSILTPKHYTISFNSNGGSIVEDITQDYNSDLELPKPTLYGKSFVGWFKNSELTEQFDCEFMPLGGAVLYAKWTNYEVILSCDEKTAISEFDTLDCDLFEVSAIDTDGNAVEVNLLVINGKQEAGSTITVRFVADGLYSESAIKTLFDIKVYGVPTLECNAEKDYFNLTDTLEPELFEAHGIDTYGESTTTTVKIVEENYKAGDKVTVILTAVDLAGNKFEREISEVKVYGAPNIEIISNKIKAIDGGTIPEGSLKVKAIDSFGEVLDFDYGWNIDKSLINAGIADGRLYFYDVISGKGSKYESKSLWFLAVEDGYYSFHLMLNSWVELTYKKNIILYLTKDTGEVVTQNIMDGWDNSGSKYIQFSNIKAGHVYHVHYAYTCSYSNEAMLHLYIKTSVPHNVDKKVFNIGYFSGKYVNITLNASDKYGNSADLTEKFYVCSTPEISEPQNANIAFGKPVTADALGITVKDSVGDLIDNINVEISEGSYVVGEAVTYRITAIDEVGNIAEKEVTVKIYGKPKLTVSIEGAKLTSELLPSEFNAKAFDTFNKELEVKVELLEGQFIKGEKVKIKFSAIDVAGNIAEIIKEMLVYSDEINLTYESNLSNLIKSTSNGEEFNAVAIDCFGNEISTELVAVSGKIEGGQIVSIKIVATDAAGNTYESQIITDIKVYDSPQIVFRREDSTINASDNLNYLFAATDSFGAELAVNIELIDGEMIAGESVTYKVSASDKAGNKTEKVFTLTVNDIG